MRTPPFDLMLVSDGKPALTARIEAALRAGSQQRIAVQLRERSLPSAQLLVLARELRALTRAHEALLLVNDRVDVAIAVGADGVQLPETGLPPDLVRGLLGREAWIGASRHDAAGLASAARQGADFATLSPLHEVAGKGPALGFAGFSALLRAAPLPVYALGGVRRDDVRALRQAGARGVAVMREVLSADDPRASTQQLLSAFTTAAV